MPHPERSVTGIPGPHHGGRAHPERIGLLGLFACGNFGNDGSMEAMALRLRARRPWADLVCFCPNPAEIERVHSIPSVPLVAARPEGLALRLDRLTLGIPRRLWDCIRIFREVGNLAALLIPGTGILDDFGTGPLGFPLVLFQWCLAARLRGVPIGFVSIGAGPIENPVSRWIMKATARMGRYRSYREDASRRFMAGLGFDAGPETIYPDLAFHLPLPPTMSNTPADQPPVVGLGVMTYSGWQNDHDHGAAIYGTYIGKLKEFLFWLLDRGHPVRLLRGDLCDQRAIDDVLAAVADARPALTDRVAFTPVESLSGLMEEIARTDIVVGTRFHNIVCALHVGRPPISIGYAAKNQEVMAAMGMGRFCQHVETFDVERLILQFTEVCESRAHYAQDIADAHRTYQDRLDSQLTTLFAQLLPTTPVETGVAQPRKV